MVCRCKDTKNFQNQNPFDFFYSRRRVARTVRRSLFHLLVAAMGAIELKS